MNDSGTPQNPRSVQTQGKDAAKELAQDAKAQGQELAQETMNQAKQSLSQVREQALTALSQAQDQVAEHGTSLANAFHKTREQLQDEDERELADLAGRVGGQVQQAADYLRGKDAKTLLHDAGALARRQPELFLGGAVLLGLIGGRFLKSSGRNSAATPTPVVSNPNPTQAPENHNIVVTPQDELGHG